MTHFELFGLPAQFVIDQAQLASAFRELQRRFHPDKFAAASERDRLLAMQKAAQINDAYQTLKSPILRAEYLLSLHGFELADEQHSMHDMEFLLQQMALREELEQLELQADSDALAAFEQRVSDLYQQQLQQLQQLLAEQTWCQANDAVRKLKFITKLQYEVEQLEERLLG